MFFGVSCWVIYRCCLVRFSLVVLVFGFGLLFLGVVWCSSFSRVLGVVVLLVNVCNGMCWDSCWCSVVSRCIVCRELLLVV